MAPPPSQPSPHRTIFEHVADAFLAKRPGLDESARKAVADLVADAAITMSLNPATAAVYETEGLGLRLVGGETVLLTKLPLDRRAGDPDRGGSCEARDVFHFTGGRT